MQLVILGAPGSGKGTQAKKLAAHFKIPQISTGDMLRESIKDGSELGREAASFINAGKLVPDELILELVEQRLKESDCYNGFILDGFPRTLAQAEGLDRILEKSGKLVNHVISLEIEKELLAKRLVARRVCSSCGKEYNLVFKPPKQVSICDICGNPLIKREDDNELTIIERLEVYQKQTEPLKAYYEAESLLRGFDGRGSIDEVSDIIIYFLER